MGLISEEEKVRQRSQALAPGGERDGKSLEA